MIIDRLRWWHLEQVLSLDRELFGPNSWTDYHFWSELGQVDTRHYLVALHKDKRDPEQISGYAGLCRYPDEAFVQTLGVHPAARGQGVGAALLQELLAVAARHGERRVSLEVRADNTAAQRLYERHGFRRVGIRRGYYEATGADAWVMTRT